MGPVVIEIDALAKTLIVRASPCIYAACALQRCAGAQATVVTNARLRGVRLRSGQQVVVVAVDGAAGRQIRLRKVVQERR